ncbi:MAG TPA: hypothetical protein VGO51_01160 [Burkholderiaceae bacterium]|jgi:hypothetical protein|nr:hypothetical protein [Burkholderiaceae bacterium]
MSTIIAGRFELQPQAEAAISELRRAGFTSEQIAYFYVNPPGQHDVYPLGGDHDKSPGAEETDKGVAAGIAAGAAAGLATVPVLGPAGPLVGAYVGALAGSLAATKEPDEMGEKDDAPPERKAGLMVAVAADDSGRQRLAIEVLHSMGASDIERAHGTIQNGDWIDFDPVAPPKLIKLAADHRA